MRGLLLLLLAATSVLCSSPGGSSSPVQHVQASYSVVEPPRGAQASVEVVPAHPTPRQASSPNPREPTTSVFLHPSSHEEPEASPLYQLPVAVRSSSEEYKPAAVQPVYQPASLQNQVSPTVPSARAHHPQPIPVRYMSVGPPAPYRPVVHRHRYPFHPPPPAQYRRPTRPITANRRQQQFDTAPRPYLSVPPRSSGPLPSPSLKRPVLSHPPSGHLIFSKPPPEVIYYGSKPPPHDFSPPTRYRVRAPVIHSPAPVPHESPAAPQPEENDVMNDLDLYIPDDDQPSKSMTSNAYGPTMSAVMMPLMMLGLTLPALGFMYTYLARRRRRRRSLPGDPHPHLERYTSLLAAALDRTKKKQ